MDDIDNAEANTAKALEIMGADPEEEATETTPVEKTEGAAETPSAEGETETVEPDETPAIDPPALWKGELKSRWNDIPPDLQREIAQQEAERNSGVGSKLEEAAKAVKAAEQERQRFAQLADFVAKSFAADPILSDAQKTDWEKLARENPAEWAAKRQAVESRVAQLQQIEGERQRLAREQTVKQLEEGNKFLEKALPGWRDEAKRTELREGLKKAALGYGYSAEELAQLTDPRSVVVLHKAAEYDRLMAAQKSAAQRQTQPVQRRVMRPGSGDQTNQPTQRFKALKSQALRTGKESDAVAAVLSAIGA